METVGGGRLLVKHSAYKGRGTHQFLPHLHRLTDCVVSHFLPRFAHSMGYFDKQLAWRELLFSLLFLFLLDFFPILCRAKSLAISLFLFSS